MATYTEANNGSVVIYEGTRFGCVPDLLNLVDENGQERELPSSGAKQKSSTLLCDVCWKWVHSGKRYTEHVNGKKHKEALAACLAHHTPSYPSLAAGRRQRRVPISSNLVSTLASALSSKKKLKGFEKGGASVMSAGSSKTLVNAEGLFALISDGFTDERKADRAYVAHLTAKIEEILRNPSVPSSSTDQNTCAENADTTSNELTTKKLASENNNGVILFYNYTHLTEAATLRDWQEELCGALGITGRTRIAKEGINGTLGGSPLALALYMESMMGHTSFQLKFSDFKTNLDCDTDSSSLEGSSQFPFLSIKLVDEICVLGIAPTELKVNSKDSHLTPAMFHEELKKMQATEQAKRDTVLIDCRNFYESNIGHFKSAILPTTRNFSEWPAYADRLIEDFQLKQKNKKVLMYCTGGIRCERGSTYLKSKGVKNVFQLSGGIHKYMQQFREDGYYKGKLFVFDRRIALDQPQPLRAPPSPPSLPPSRSSSSLSHGTGSAQSSSGSASCGSSDSSHNSAKPNEDDGSITHNSNDNDLSNNTVSTSTVVGEKEVVGKCEFCLSAFDQYDKQCRCTVCRVLVLACHGCRKKGKLLVCKYCTNRLYIERKRVGSSNNIKCALSKEELKEEQKQRQRKQEKEILEEIANTHATELTSSMASLLPLSSPSPSSSSRAFDRGMKRKTPEFADKSNTPPKPDSCSDNDVAAGDVKTGGPAVPSTLSKNQLKKLRKAKMREERKALKAAAAEKRKTEGTDNVNSEDDDDERGYSGVCGSSHKPIKKNVNLNHCLVAKEGWAFYKQAE